MKRKYLILVFIAAALVGIQFIPVDRTNPPVDPSKNFVDMYATPSNIKQILQTSCYDCHSNETVYPKYAYVAPISWWLKNHIEEGRHHLNFSEFGNYPQDKAQHKIKECSELIQENEMPLSSYTLMHSEAKLTNEERTELVQYFNSLNQH